MLADNASATGGGFTPSPIPTIPNGAGGSMAAPPKAPGDNTTDPQLDFSGSPYASVYANDALAAHTAYQNALNSTQLKRSNLATSAGFNQDGSVDGLNLTGGYQQMQRGQGQALEATHEAAMSRHIGSAGIAAQPESDLRYSNAVQQANFGRGYENDRLSLDDADTNSFNSYQSTLMNLQLQAIADARAAQNFPGNSGGGGGGGGDDSGPQLTNNQYAKTPVGQSMVQQILAHPASAGSSGAAQVLLNAAMGKIVPNYQANKNTANERFVTPTKKK